MGYNTIPSNPWPLPSDQAGGSGEAYTLPIASADELGGVKVGTGLSINAETGALSNSNPTPYSLPTAAADTLGGVKVGTGLTISEGVLSANSQLVDYDTDEVDTGVKWIDGKEIYRLVVNIGTLPDNDTKTITLGLSIDSLIKLQGSVKASNSGFLSLPFSSFDSGGAYSAWLSIDASGDLVVTDNAAFGTAGYTGICVIEYTKVTL